jgi:ABC-2 type transport system ATP-binding protein
VLTLDAIRKAFGTTQAVNDLSLAIRRGEVFGLLGPNGAGKSTTIGIATGLITPDAGSVTIEGLGSPGTPSVRRHIGVAPQSLALYMELSAVENLTFFGRMYGLHGGDLALRAAAVLDMVGLSARARDRVKAYSGGMQRRLNLAVALLHDPPMLLLDEPTAGVDPQSRNNILELVRDLARQGRTIVYTTHYMEEAARLCDRVGIIDKGRMLALGTVPELIAAHGGGSVVTITRAGHEERIRTDDPLREIARVLASSGSVPSATGAAAASAFPAPSAPGVPPSNGTPVDGVRIDRPDLEGVFLSLTGRSLRD